MIRIVLAGATTALALVSPQPAGAAGPPPLTGFLCSWATMDNPVADGRTLGYLDGGPYVIADGTDLRTGRMSCSLQWGARHGDPDLVSATSVTTPGVVTLPATPFEYASDYRLPNTCASVEVDGAGTFYWDDLAEEWSTSALAYCDIQSFGDDGEPVTTILETYDDVNEYIEEEVDPVVCPLLAGLAPGAGPVVVEPEGDLSVPTWQVWDCPPYDGSR
ncbi:MAG TPA: hypothetical protein VNQ77_14020 [Frankiaceae bacterium]|nr:hypothetical protein [Frankiaceae bacterium]